MPTRLYVEYYDGRRMFTETRTIEVERHDAAAAREACAPGEYGFRFRTCVYQLATVQGTDEVVECKHKWRDVSGMHFMPGAEVWTVEDVKAMNHEAKAKGERDYAILLSNMECNSWPRVVRTRTGNVTPLGEDAILLG